MARQGTAERIDDHRGLTGSVPQGKRIGRIGHDDDLVGPEAVNPDIHDLAGRLDTRSRMM